MSEHANGGGFISPHTEADSIPAILSPGRIVFGTTEELRRWCWICDTTHDLGEHL